MDVGAILGALWRQRWLVLLVFLVEVGAAVGLLSRAPRTYTAHATMVVAPKVKVDSTEIDIPSLRATMGELASSTAVLDGASRRLTPSRPVDYLRGRVSASTVGGTVLLRISVDDANPRLAAAIANAVAAELPFHDPTAGQAFVFTVIEPARPPSAPSSPQTRLVLAAAVVLGAALATGAGLLRDNTQRRVATAEEAAELTGSAVLARLPRPRDPKAVTALDADDPATAALRALRISLEFAAARDPIPVVVVTSAVPDDTEPWLATNLAVALAQVQHRTLLVDGNLDEPRTTPVFAGTGPNGLAQALLGADLDALVHPGPVEGLSVLGAGEAPSDVAELLETRFGELLRTWTSRYDVVVIDAPPVTVSDDARVMAVGGAALLSVPAGRVAPRVLRDVAASLRVVSARVAGLVLVGGEAAATNRRRRRRRRRSARP
ncbi:MAG TPA: CpsD/CapB family tyrosine-protein kinase [Mycobacteriales bacterium]|nr:CpsD/CapB family tyrosine-protein kinase [Mycobacteriales bacterium]